MTKGKFSEYFTNFVNMFFDTHNHSQFSFDGEATTVEKSAAAAISSGLGGICFTDHCDPYVPSMKAAYEPIRSEVFDIEAQQAEIDRVQELIAAGDYGRQAARKFRVFKGIEVGLEEKGREQYRQILDAHSFDQVIASVHYIDDTDPYYGPYYSDKTWKEAYGHYLETILTEIRWLGDFDILGHFDYIARYAPYTKESILYKDFPDLLDEIFKYLIENGKGLEINTKSYQKHGFRQPSLDKNILMRYLELGGEILCLGSDSHNADHVGRRFEYFAQYIKSSGFRRLGHFEGRRLKMVTI